MTDREQQIFIGRLLTVQDAITSLNGEPFTLSALQSLIKSGMPESDVVFMLRVLRVCEFVRADCPGDDAMFVENSA